MITIRQLSKLLGITSQMIRTYEHEEIVTSLRDSSNYRRFSHDLVIKLIKCRRLVSMGFSTRQIKRLTKGTSYKEMQLMLKERADQLEEEIHYLVQKRNSLTPIFNLMQDMQQKNGTCEFITVPATYCLPVIRSDHVILGDEHRDMLEQWNKYAFEHIEALRIKPDIFLQGAYQSEVALDYIIRASSAERANLDTSQASLVPEHLCVRAYAICKGDLMAMDAKVFDFAAAFIRENNLRIVDDLMFYIPFWMQEGDETKYLIMDAHVERNTD